MPRGSYLRLSDGHDVDYVTIRDGVQLAVNLRNYTCDCVFIKLNRADQIAISRIATTPSD